MSDMLERIWVEAPDIFDGMGIWHSTAVTTTAYTRSDIADEAKAAARLEGWNAALEEAARLLKAKWNDPDMTGKDLHETILALADKDHRAEARVLRGGNVIVVDGLGYHLAALAEASYALVKDTDNPAFHMPGWFYSGSPYAEQIKALGVTPYPIPKNFRAEYVPDLGKVWRRGPTAWEAYSTGLSATLAERDALVYAGAQALDLLRADGRGDTNIAMCLAEALAAAKPSA